MKKYKEKNRWKRIQKEKKRIAKQYKHCEKLLQKAFVNSDLEFCIGGQIAYIKKNCW
jgi:hypothetical protein